MSTSGKSHTTTGPIKLFTQICTKSSIQFVPTTITTPHVRSKFPGSTGLFHHSTGRTVPSTTPSTSIIATIRPTTNGTQTARTKLSVITRVQVLPARCTRTTSTSPCSQLSFPAVAPEKFAHIRAAKSRRILKHVSRRRSTSWKFAPTMCLKDFAKRKSTCCELKRSTTRRTSVR